MWGLSSREKFLSFLAIITSVYFIFMNLIFNPQLESIKKNRAKLAVMKQQLLQAEIADRLAKAGLKKPSVGKVYSKEEQIGSLIGFVEARLKRYGIRETSFNQTGGQGRIILQIDFVSTYRQLLRFLNSLHYLKSYYLLDSISVAEEQQRLVVKMKLAAPYK